MERKWRYLKIICLFQRTIKNCWIEKEGCFRFFKCYSNNKQNLQNNDKDMLSVTEEINKLLDRFSNSKGGGHNFISNLNDI